MFSRRRIRVAIASGILVACCLALVPAGANAQQDGYVGVFLDAAGTIPCGNVPAFTPTTLYVVATLGGATRDGITGIEMRLEVVSTSNYFLSYVPAPGSCDPGCSDLLDSAGCLDDIAGGVLTWAQCQTSGNGQILLATLQLIVLQPDGALRIQVRRRHPPGDPLFACPLFTLCDAPVFTKVCMTSQMGADPVAFRTVINDPNCVGPVCVVGVESRTWSSVKRLYHD